MNNHALIPISQSVVNSQTIPTVDARKIHAFLGINKDFTSWIKTQIERAKLKENRDFVKLTQKGELSKTGQMRDEYHLTLRAGQHVSMMSQSDKGVEVRDYFIECEDRAKNQVATYSSDPIIAMRMEQIALEKRTTLLEQRVESIAPSLTASAITTVLGAISHAAKIYRQAQQIKHVKVSVSESSEYFRLMLHDKFCVADIGYLSDVSAACRFLQNEAKKHQAVANDWYERNSLFGGGAI